MTGDYSHRDFRGLLNGCVPVTLMPIKQVLKSSYEFELVVLAQAIPDQFSREEVECLQARFPLTPIVALLGSWCEGEVRTGTPIPGLRRIYWHQWMGQFDAFCYQLQSAGISNLHLPSTATVADQVLRIDAAHQPLKSKLKCVGISATNRFQFDSLKDALENLGYRCRWIELEKEELLSDPQQTARFQPICVDTDVINEDVYVRLNWLRDRFPAAKIILITNFPRIDQTDRIKKAGVYQIISKPYHLDDLAYAVNRSVGHQSRPV